MEDVGEEEQEELLARKLALCSVLFPFPGKEEEERDRRRKAATLEELADFAREQLESISRSMLADMVEMVGMNIFRPLVRQSTTVLDEEEEWREPSWPHLLPSYSLLLTILEHPAFEPSHLRLVINKLFADNLLGLLYSQDSEEREVVKTVLHRIYGTFVSLRRFLRLRISELLLQAAHCQEELLGIPQLLDILSAILKGLAVPLKEEFVEVVRSLQ